jgi:hypothetical protein
MVIEHVKTQPHSSSSLRRGDGGESALIFINTINEQSILYLARCARWFGACLALQSPLQPSSPQSFQCLLSLRSLVEANGLTVVHHHRGNNSWRRWILVDVKRLRDILSFGRNASRLFCGTPPVRPLRSDPWCADHLATGIVMMPVLQMGTPAKWWHDPVVVLMTVLASSAVLSFVEVAHEKTQSVSPPSRKRLNTQI